MVKFKRFTLGIVQDLKSQGYKWTKASDDKQRISLIAEEYHDAVVVTNADTGMNTLYTRGPRVYVGRKFGKFPVREVERTDERVIVTPMYGGAMHFKTITSYPIGEAPPKKTVEEEAPIATDPIEFGTAPLEYQKKLPGIKETAQAEFAGIPEMPKKVEQKKPETLKEYLYTTLEEPGKPVAPEEELEPKKEKKPEERKDADLGEFLAWTVLTVGGTLGVMKTLDQRSGVFQG